MAYGVDAAEGIVAVGWGVIVCGSACFVARGDIRTVLMMLVRVRLPA